MKVTLFILIQNKPKFKKTTISPNDFCKEVPQTIVPGFRPDNQWLLYNSKTVPRDPEEWDKPRYVHDRYSGFYSWPKELKVYSASCEQPSAAKRMDDLTEHEKEIYSFFSDSNNVDSLVKYLAMEEKKGKDQFNVHRFLVFKVSFTVC